MLKTAKSANKQQKALEAHYLKLQTERKQKSSHRYRHCTGIYSIKDGKSPEQLIA